MRIDRHSLERVDVFWEGKMYRFQQIRHYANREIKYGFSIAIDMSDYGALGFECFMIVDTKWLGGDEYKPLYLRNERLDDMLDYFRRPEEGIENYSEWTTDNVRESKPIMSGRIEWQGQMEASGDMPYFTSRDQATEYGKLFDRLYDLADEFLGTEDEDEDDVDDE